MHLYHDQNGRKEKRKLSKRTQILWKWGKIYKFVEIGEYAICIIGLTGMGAPDYYYHYCYYYNYYYYGDDNCQPQGICYYFMFCVSFLTDVFVRLLSGVEKTFNVVANSPELACEYSHKTLKLIKDKLHNN